MIVVSDASPLISLAKIDCLHLLPDLFGQVVIAPEVHHEVVGAGGERPGAMAIQNANWIQVQAVKELLDFNNGATRIDSVPVNWRR